MVYELPDFSSFVQMIECRFTYQCNDPGTPTQTLVLPLGSADTWKKQTDMNTALKTPLDSLPSLLSVAISLENMEMIIHHKLAKIKFQILPNP